MNPKFFVGDAESLLFGKMKRKFSITQDCCNVLDSYVEKHIENNNNTFDIKNLFGRYNTNVISSVVFGTESDCINDSNNLFYHFGMKAFQPSFQQQFAI